VLNCTARQPNPVAIGAMASLGRFNGRQPWATSSPTSADFDSRTYGYSKLSDLIDATTLFEPERRSPGDGKPAVIYARDKRRRRATARPVQASPEAGPDSPP